MRYDYRNRMVVCDDATGTLATYGYDCLGRRLVRPSTTGRSPLRLRRRRHRRCRDAAGTLAWCGCDSSVYGVVSGSVEAVVRLRMCWAAWCQFDGSGVLRGHECRDFGETAQKDTLPVSFAGYASCRWPVRTFNRYLRPATSRFTTLGPVGRGRGHKRSRATRTYTGNKRPCSSDPTGLS